MSFERRILCLSLALVVNVVGEINGVAHGLQPKHPKKATVMPTPLESLGKDVTTFRHYVALGELAQARDMLPTLERHRDELSHQGLFHTWMGKAAYGRAKAYLVRSAEASISQAIQLPMLTSPGSSLEKDQEKKEKPSPLRLRLDKENQAALDILVTYAPADRWSNGWHGKHHILARLSHGALSQAFEKVRSHSYGEAKLALEKAIVLEGGLTSMGLTQHPWLTHRIRRAPKRLAFQLTNDLSHFAKKGQLTDYVAGHHVFLALALNKHYELPPILTHRWRGLIDKTLALRVRNTFIKESIRQCKTLMDQTPPQTTLATNIFEDGRSQFLKLIRINPALVVHSNKLEKDFQRLERVLIQHTNQLQKPKKNPFRSRQKSDSWANH